MLPFQGSRVKKEKYKEKKRKERRKKRKRKTEKHLCFETVCWRNIAGPYKYLFGPRLFKFWLYFKCPHVEIYLLCYLPSELPSFACISFSASFRFNLFSLNVLFAFKNITREIGNIRLQIIIFYLNLGGHIFRYPRV